MNFLSPEMEIKTSTRRDSDVNDVEALSAGLSVRVEEMKRKNRSVPSVPSSASGFVYPSLESLPLHRVLKYHLPRKLIEGKWYRQHYRITCKDSFKSLRKKLLWKVLFSKIDSIEFLVLDHCIQQSWRESRTAGILDLQVLILQSLGSEQRVHTLRMDQKLASFRPSTRLISLCSDTGTSDEEESKLFLKKNLKLPDKVSQEQLIETKLVSTVSPTPPPKQVIGVGYKDHGSMKKDHELGFEIVSGMQDTEQYDQIVLSILNQT